MNLKLATMRTLKFALPMVFAMSVIACGPDSKPENQTQEEPTVTETEAPAEPKTESSPKGIGEVKEVKLTDPLDEKMVKEGQMIFDMKCASCHKLSDERVVGPGWAGITNKRAPEWIMNMITNVDVMLTEDPQAQALLEECLVRMPNQNVSVTDARSILEFMRSNDMEKVKSKDQAAIK